MQRLLHLFFYESRNSSQPVRIVCFILGIVRNIRLVSKEEADV